jgi:hypothetical protein
MAIKAGGGKRSEQLPHGADAVASKRVVVCRLKRHAQKSMKFRAVPHFGFLKMAASLPRLYGHRKSGRNYLPRAASNEVIEMKNLNLASLPRVLFSRLFRINLPLPPILP